MFTVSFAWEKNKLVPGHFQLGFTAFWIFLQIDKLCGQRISSQKQTSRPGNQPYGFSSVSKTDLGLVKVYYVNAIGNQGLQVKLDALLSR